MANNKYKTINIDKEDVAFIMGPAFRYFDAIITGAYCNKCKSTHTSTITHYNLFINHENHIIIEGFCDKCKHPLRRCIETGEKAEAAERAEITRMVKIDLLGYS